MFKIIEKYALETVLWMGVATFAAMVALPLYSAKADVSHCGVNESRMNPTALSDYQECWLDVYSMDEDYGVLGSLFWVRANGEYYSTQLSNLRTESQRAAFLSEIQTDVVVSVADEVVTEGEATIVTIEKEIVEVEVIVEVIVEDMEEIERLNGIIDLLQPQADKVPGLEDTVKDLKQQVYSLTGHADKMRQKLNWAVTNGGEFKGNSDTLEGAVLKAQDKIADLREIRADLEAEIVELKATIDSMYTIDTLNALNTGDQKKLANVFTVSEGILLSETIDEILTHVALAKKSDAYTTGNGTVDNSGTAVDISGGEFLINEEAVSSDSANTVLDIISAVSSDWHAIENDLNAALEEVYDRGYNDGYADGFADGFKNGVDSVLNG